MQIFKYGYYVETDTIIGRSQFEFGAEILAFYLEFEPNSIYFDSLHIKEENLSSAESRFKVTFNGFTVVDAIYNSSTNLWNLIHFGIPCRGPGFMDLEYARITDYLADYNDRTRMIFDNFAG